MAGSRQVRSHRRDRGRAGGAARGPGAPAGRRVGRHELDIRLLVDHRERLVKIRVALYNDLLWHLHDIWPELAIPGCSLLYKKWATRIAGAWHAPSRPHG